MLRFLVITILLVVLVGCSMPYRDAHIVNVQSFHGIADALDNNGTDTVKVVIIHGMCSRNGAQWAYDQFTTMSELLGDYIIEKSEGLRVYPPESSGDAVYVYKGEFPVNDKIVELNAIYWGELTDSRKMSLCYELQASDGRICDDSSTDYPHDRARYHDSIKATMMNDCLADPIMYSGSLGNEIRAGVMAALDDIMNSGDDEASSAPIFVVSSSLGSKIIFDSLRQASLEEGDYHDVSNVFLQQTHTVYLLANQLPFLDLGVAEDEEPSFTWFVENAGVESNGSGNLHLVAFSDPNDILSYSLTNSYVDQLHDVVITDVVVSNGYTYFGKLANPVNAHQDYIYHKDVSRLIMCGNPYSDYCR